MRGLRFDQCQPNRVIIMNEDLSGANLSRADLSRATLSGATVSVATLDGVIGADFTGALNVPERYLKD